MICCSEGCAIDDVFCNSLPAVLPSLRWSLQHSRACMCVCVYQNTVIIEKRTVQILTTVKASQISTFLIPIASYIFISLKIAFWKSIKHMQAVMLYYVELLQFREMIHEMLHIYVWLDVTTCTATLWVPSVLLSYSIVTFEVSTCAGTTFQQFDNINNLMILNNLWHKHWLIIDTFFTKRHSALSFGCMKYPSGIEIWHKIVMLLYC
jgi:hypothetical protein